MSWKEIPEEIRTVIAGLAGSAVTGLATWLWNRGERLKSQNRADEAEAREKAAEKRADEALEMQRKVALQAERDREELRMIRERANVPYFMPLGKNPGSISINAIGEIDADPSNGLGNRSYCGRVLRSLCPEADASLLETTPIYLLLSNAGESFQELKASLDGEPIKFGYQDNFDEPGGLYWICYPHILKRHGEPAELRIAFMAKGGTNHLHVYKTRRGFFELRRTFPEGIQIPSSIEPS